MSAWRKCDECGRQMTEWETIYIDFHLYPVDDDMKVCEECYENFYLYYDQTRTEPIGGTEE